MSGMNTLFAYKFSWVQFLGFLCLPSANSLTYTKRITSGCRTRIKPWSKPVLWRDMTQNVICFWTNVLLVCNTSPQVEKLTDRGQLVMAGANQDVLLLCEGDEIRTPQRETKKCVRRYSQRTLPCTSFYFIFFFKKGKEPLGKRFPILLRCNRVPQSLILFASGTHRVGCSWAAINYDTTNLKPGWQIFQPTVCSTSKLPPLASVSLHTDCRSDSISLGPYAPVMHLSNWILNQWAAYR